MAKKDVEAKFETSLKFIERLKKMAPKNISIVDELADLLGVSKDSAYRRLRGEIALTLDETLLICKKFKISLDMFTNKSQGKVTFGYKSIGSDVIDLDGYLESIIKDFSNLDKVEKAHLFFAAEDLPLFHHMDYEFLTPFKFFYWKKSILNDPTLEGKKFDIKHIPKKTLDLAKKIGDIYNQMPSTEIWTEESISSTLSQIQYFWEAGLFATKADAINVCNDVLAMMEHMNVQAEFSTKFSRKKKVPETSLNNFNLYSCEVQIGNNTLFVQADKWKVSLLSFNTFNSLMTYNLDYCLENERWINNLIKKSILISSVSEKQRYQFFKKIYSMIDDTKNSIKNS